MTTNHVYQIWSDDVADDGLGRSRSDTIDLWVDWTPTEIIAALTAALPLRLDVLLEPTVEVGVKEWYIVADSGKYTGKRIGELVHSDDCSCGEPSI